MDRLYRVAHDVRVGLRHRYAAADQLRRLDGDVVRPEDGDLLDLFNALGADDRSQFVLPALRNVRTMLIFLEPSNPRSG